MDTGYPQPIGLRKKPVIERDIEQIAFKLTGDNAALKRRFVELLNERGLEIKAVLLEFIERYVEFCGNLGVVRLGVDSTDLSQKWPDELKGVCDDLHSFFTRFGRDSAEWQYFSEQLYGLMGNTEGRSPANNNGNVAPDAAVEPSRSEGIEIRPGEDAGRNNGLRKRTERTLESARGDRKRAEAVIDKAKETLEATRRGRRRNQKSKRSA